MERETSDGGPYQRPEWSVCGAGDGDGRRLVVGLFHEYLSKELTFFSFCCWYQSVQHLFGTFPGCPRCCA